jgi:Fe-S-cluster containining protein
MRESSSAEIATVNVRANVGGYELKMSVNVPAGPTRLDDLVPLLQILSDKVVAAAEHEAHEQGRCISCREGCGACCRQLVPLSPVDARNIARLVDELPEPRRSEIRARFAAARQRLEKAGMWDRLNNRQQWPKGISNDVGLDYFRLAIPCPFLEDESCSIHKDRPLTCREYLVTSPSENCASPTPESVESLPMPAKVWVAAARCEPDACNEQHLNWVPLVQALDWAAEQPNPPATSSALDIVSRVIKGLARSGNADRAASTGAPIT